VSFIVKYNVALPYYRISDNVLHPRMRSKGDHAICYSDEDIITLAYRAAENMVNEIDALFFATTTPVFKNRYHASYLAGLLGLPEGILALDIGTTHRAGTDAVILAESLLQTANYNNILVIASNVNYPSIGSEVPQSFGHAAVAILLSNEGGITEIKTAKSYSCAMSEEFSYKGITTKYDPRFARTQGFKNNIKTVLQQREILASETDHLYLNSPYAKLAFKQLKKAGFDLKSQLCQDAVTSATGHTGAVHGLLFLIHALENKTGNILLLDYHNGTNVIQFHTQKNNGRSLDQPHEYLEHYQDYLQLKKKGDFNSEEYESMEMFSSEMMQFREKDTLLKLIGHKCTSCGTIYLMKSTRCNACRSDQFDPAKLSRTGTVYSVTSEYYFPHSFGPTQMVVIDLQGGGRITVQQTDDMYPNELNLIKIGDSVTLVLRKMMENDQKPNYFWKCVKI